jgi:superfamily I DNA/RNA helicase
VLSTIHSAKGQEWDAVFVLNVTDGCIPSDMAVGDHEQIEEERRLLYVAMTRQAAPAPGVAIAVLPHPSASACRWSYSGDA